MKKLWQTFLVVGILGASLSTISFAANPFELVKPNQWDYKAVTKFVEDGLVTKPQGMVLGNKAYSRYELLPLIIKIVEKEEVASKADQKLIRKLRTYYQEDIEVYKANQEKVAEATQAKADAKDEAVKGEATAEGNKKPFVIDDSRVRVSGETKLFIDNDKHKKGALETKVGVTIGVK